MHTSRNIKSIHDSYEFATSKDQVTPIFDQISTFLSLYGVSISDINWGGTFKISPTSNFPFTIMYASVSLDIFSGAMIAFNLSISVPKEEQITRGYPASSTHSIPPKVLLEFLQGNFITEPYIGRIGEYEDA